MTEMGDVELLSSDLKVSVIIPVFGVSAYIGSVAKY